uniref:Uncharacterized protein n=1 Tax=Setaria viridis TaxID=4556 RepID=A0A4U6UMJ4_SETVI|nr:hypothetical protein SEVIR_5G002950v2 [Setaria viridis]
MTGRPAHHLYPPAVPPALQPTRSRIRVRRALTSVSSAWLACQGLLLPGLYIPPPLHPDPHLKP